MKSIINLKNTLLKRYELWHEPVIVRVNDFKEEAVKNFAKEMSKAHSTGQPVIPIIIDSYGGYAYSLLAMIGIIEDAELPVATIAVGKSMSAGDVYAAAYRTASIGIAVKAAIDAFKYHYNAIMEGTFDGELVKVSSASGLVGAQKNLGKAKVYCTPSNLKPELLGRHIIESLMSIFWEGAQKIPCTEDVDPFPFPGKIAGLLSENYKRVFRESVAANPGVSQLYYRLQLVTDYICGMTDSFAKRLYGELTHG